ncbi:MAG TPA: class F sortase, partial [Coriobacteriia bacterium]|nr:class F sortase [Coriobacteriia bacterium]
KGRLIAAGLVGCALALALALGGVVLAQDEDVGRAVAVAPIARRERPVYPEAPAAIPGVLPTSEVVRDGLLRVPRSDLSVPLGQVQAVDGIVNPPTSDAAYVVSGYGDPHGAGTVYVAMHSGRGVEAVGNALIDVEAGQARVAAGDGLYLDGVRYLVREVRLVDKSVLPDEPDLWSSVDGRLVLFTCLQRSSGPSIQNVVVIAERES